MYVSSICEVSINQWNRLCKKFGLPCPEYNNDEDSWGETFHITKDMFDQYRSFCKKTVESIDKTGFLSMDEHFWLTYWGIIYNNYLEKTENEFPIVFG